MNPVKLVDQRAERDDEDGYSQAPDTSKQWQGPIRAHLVFITGTDWKENDTRRNTTRQNAQVLWLYVL